MRSAISSELAVSVLFALMAVAPGCAPPVSALRFANLPPVWSVDDRRPIPKPAELRAAHNAEEMRDARAPLLHTLALHGRVPARGVNSLGEVPDSTWFENRIGTRDLSPEAIARGPGDGRGPVAPLVVVAMKSSGHGLGVRIEDALGDGYLLKFDAEGEPEVETAVGAVVQRLLWASGYHVPEDHVVIVPRSDLFVAERATRTRKDGVEVRMTQADLEELLAKTAQPSGGRLVRALSSAIIPGVPIGGYPVSGVRADDPNDRVPHELRRDVRGQLTFFAWLAHSDAKVDNTLDVWVPLREGADRGFVRHYILDFGLALGAKHRGGLMPHDGYAYNFDLEWGAASAFTLGLYRRPWERLDASARAQRSRYGAHTFDPRRFRTSRPYVPFLYADRFDAYWASKIIVRFGREHVQAAVEQGRFSDPRRAARVAEAILARQRRVARHWFHEVAPIDSFRLERDGARAWLCARDLWLLHGFGADPAETRYEVEVFDAAGEPIDEPVGSVGRVDGRVCVQAPRVTGRGDDYRIVRFSTRRSGRRLPHVLAHVAPDPVSGLIRLIGVERR